MEPTAALYSPVRLTVRFARTGRRVPRRLSATHDREESEKRKGARNRKQRFLACSVENLSGSNDHHIMCNDPEDDLAALAPIGPRP